MAIYNIKVDMINIHDVMTCDGSCESGGIGAPLTPP